MDIRMPIMTPNQTIVLERGLENFTGKRIYVHIKDCIIQGAAMMKFGGSSTSQLKVEYLIPCRGIPTALVNLDFNSDCTFRLVILNNLPLAPPIPFAMDRVRLAY